MRAAAVQLNSREDKAGNLAVADRLTRAAAADGASLVVLPEKFNVLGTHDDYLAGAEPLDGPDDRVGARAGARARHRLRARVDRGAPRRPRQALEHLGARRSRRRGEGRLPQDPHVRRGGRRAGLPRVGDARRAATRSCGRSTADGVGLGLTVCYDLRFPELYRTLAVEGARVLLVPAAFTEVTGRAHWEILIRARAIENQAFVVAADQIGPHPPDKVSYGGSMIVDPWGELLARAPDEVCFVAADLDLERQDEVREKLPSLANRVPDAYRRPGGGRLLMATAPRAGAGGQAPPDPRRGGPRIRAPGLPPLPRVGRGRRGRRGLRPGLPLLQLEGGDPQHALPRALGDHARGDRRD